MYAKTPARMASLVGDMELLQRPATKVSLVHPAIRHCDSKPSNDDVEAAVNAEEEVQGSWGTRVREAICALLKVVLQWATGNGRKWICGVVVTIAFAVVIGVQVKVGTCCQDLETRVSAHRDLLALHQRFFEQARTSRVRRDLNAGRQVFRKLLDQGYTRSEALRILRAQRSRPALTTIYAPALENVRTTSTKPSVLLASAEPTVIKKLVTTMTSTTGMTSTTQESAGRIPARVPVKKRTTSKPSDSTPSAAIARISVPAPTEAHVQLSPDGPKLASRPPPVDLRSYRELWETSPPPVGRSWSQAGISPGEGDPLPTASTRGWSSPRFTTKSWMRSWIYDSTFDYKKSGSPEAGHDQATNTQKSARVTKIGTGPAAKSYGNDEGAPLGTSTTSGTTDQPAGPTHPITNGEVAAHSTPTSRPEFVDDAQLAARTTFETIDPPLESAHQLDDEEEAARLTTTSPEGTRDPSAYLIPPYIDADVPLTQSSHDLTPTILSALALTGTLASVLILIFTVCRKTRKRARRSSLEVGGIPLLSFRPIGPPSCSQALPDGPLPDPPSWIARSLRVPTAENP